MCKEHYSCEHDLAEWKVLWSIEHREPLSVVNRETLDEKREAIDKTEMTAYLGNLVYNEVLVIALL